MEAKKKVVQTELEESDYRVLLNAAKRKNMSIKEAAREALLSWNASNSDLSEDPFFRLNPATFKVKVRSDEIENFLYRKTDKKRRAGEM